MNREPISAQQPPGIRRADLLIACVFWLLAAAGLTLFTWLRGQDINYDLMNYHWFTVGAALEADPFRHIAGLQQFLNPYLYLPHHLLHSWLSPLRAAAVITWIQALNLPLIYLIGCVVLREVAIAPWVKRLLSLLAGLVAAAGPMFLTETGTSFADSLASIPTLGGVLLLLLAIGGKRSSPVFALIGTAGFLFGISVGLKLTSACFALGAVASLFALPSWKFRLRSWLVLAFGGLAGGLLTNGYWTFRLWSEFRSPIFPFYNRIFQSPYFPTENEVDRRFLPENLFDALTYPFQWTVGLHPSSELPFRDIRFAILSVLLILTIIAIVGQWRSHRSRGGENKDSKAVHLGLLLFCLSGYALWLSLFGIQRYLTPIELLAGPAMLSMLSLMSLKTRAMTVTAGILMLATIASTRPSDFGHSNWMPEVAETQLPADILESNGIFLLLGDPMTYIIPDFGPETQFINIGMVPDPSNAMGDRVRKILAQSAAPVYSIQGDAMSSRTLDFLNGFGLRQDGIDCHHFQTLIGARAVGLGLCDVSMNPRAENTTAPTYPLGRDIRFGGAERNAVFFETSGWGEETPDGRAWDPNADTLRLQFEIAEEIPPNMEAILTFSDATDLCSISVKLNGAPIRAIGDPTQCTGAQLRLDIAGSHIPANGSFDLQLQNTAQDQPQRIVESFRLSPQG
ncbi:hypothetical protein SAMN05216456_0049 [Devosia crocina]|uniref:4-amino-4-deoxy-L-arabinose transferase n=1 Tax=Devosia crocina TaxID=429728 RepID=A0A1I7MVZ5_9HYPH|nr:hypothetical protein [Devosia crocina]SFV26582.1 hypothetical protein SAMN05216456_0049 [Devosia crocina]